MRSLAGYLVLGVAASPSGLSGIVHSGSAGLVDGAIGTSSETRGPSRAAYADLRRRALASGRERRRVTWKPAMADWRGWRQFILALACSLRCDPTAEAAGGRSMIAGDRCRAVVGRSVTLAPRPVSFPSAGPHRSAASASWFPPSKSNRPPRSRRTSPSNQCSERCSTKRRRLSSG